MHGHIDRCRVHPAPGPTEVVGVCSGGIAGVDGGVWGVGLVHVDGSQDIVKHVLVHCKFGVIFGMEVKLMLSGSEYSLEQLIWQGVEITPEDVLEDGCNDGFTHIESHPFEV